MVAVNPQKMFTENLEFLSGDLEQLTLTQEDEFTPEMSVSQDMA